MKATTFDVETRSRSQMVDITSQVAEAVGESGISEGTVTIYVPHTTAGVT